MRLGLGLAAAITGAAAWGQALADPPRLLIPREIDFAAEAAKLRGAGEERRLRPPPEQRFDRVAFDDGEDRLARLGVRDGGRFGERGRLYLFAADGETAVGYNFTRGEGGGWAREGLSMDAGAFIGDAQAGVAWRRDDVQISFGYVRREIERRSRLGRSLDEDVVAFQLSFTPGR